MAQSILKEINPECSLEGLMLKLQYYGHLMQRVDSGNPDAGKDGGQEKGMTEDEMVDEMVDCNSLQSTGLQRVGHDLVTEQQQRDYTESNN